MKRIIFPLVTLLFLNNCLAFIESQAAAYEESIEAAYLNAQNVHSRLATTTMDQIKIAKKYSEDVKEMMKLAIQRYDHGPLLQFVKEQNAYDPKLWERVMVHIEAGRKDFSNEQTMMIDRKRAYQTKLRSWWWKRCNDDSFPSETYKQKEKDYVPVTAESTQEIFKTKKDKSLIDDL